MAKICVLLVLSCFVASVHPQFPNLAAIFNPAGLLPANPITTGINNIVGGVTSSIPNLGGTDIQSAMTQSIQTVSGLLNSVTSAIAPDSVISGLTNALLPQSNALASLTSQLTGTGAASCLTSVVNGFRNVTTGGMMNFLNCVLPLAVQTTKYQQSITDISNKLANLTKISVTNSWNCVIKSFLTINFAESINCFTIALIDITEFAKSTSQTIQNLTTDSRNMVLQLPSCSTKTMLTTTQNANALLQNIISCASGKGVNATLPSLPGVPDLSSIVNNGINALEKASNVLTGASNPLSSVASILNSATQTASAVTQPLLQNTIGNAIAPALNVINQAVAATTGSSNPSIIVCATTAQAAAAKILPAATTNTVKCTASIGVKSAALTAQLTTLTTTINAKIATGNTAIISNCSLAAIGFNAGKLILCFETALAQFNSFIDTSIAKGQEIFDAATALTGESAGCLGTGAEIAAKSADEVVTTMTNCLMGSEVEGTLDTYNMTTLDTAYVRKSYRRQGFGISLLKDLLMSWPDANIGFSKPISLMMWKVLEKFLKINDDSRYLLWEVDGTGNEGSKKLIWFCLKKKKIM